MMPGSRLASSSLDTMVLRPRSFVSLVNSNTHGRGSVDGQHGQALQTETCASCGRSRGPRGKHDSTCHRSHTSLLHGSEKALGHHALAGAEALYACASATSIWS